MNRSQTDFDHGAICTLNMLRRMLLDETYTREEVIAFIDDVKKEVFKLKQGKMEDVNFK
jgi:hypothetical protein